MRLTWIERIGEWNPQLLRELKGRLKRRNVAIALIVSFVGQFVLFFSGSGNNPHFHKSYSVWDRYCNLWTTYKSYQTQQSQLQNQYRHLQEQFLYYSGSQHYNPEKVQQLKASIASLKGKIEDLNQVLGDTGCPLSEMNMHLWWQDYYRDIFISLSLIILFALLVVGSYMLITNLGDEERRGTLNFIRLSPQSTAQFCLGKLLGVPSLVYLAIAVTVPLHLWSGLFAKISLTEIISFWVILIASSGFLFSAALLFGLFGSWFSGFQAWLGSGAIFVFLLVANFKPINHSSLDWLNLFSPSVLFPYLLDKTNQIQGWQFFNLPLGIMGFSLVVLALLNYGLWTYWIGQAFNRQFRNPGTTLLSKRQSYLLTACWITFTLGFALQQPSSEDSSQFPDNFYVLLTFNLVLFLGLIAALSPQRQSLQDWARYRHQNRLTVNSSLMADLLRGEKSPALFAIAMNLMIVVLPLTGWIWLGSVDIDSKRQAFASLILSLSIILIYAAIAQLMLMMKTPNRGIWTTGIIFAAIILPPSLLNVLSIVSGQNGGGLWLFTAFPWNYVMRHASVGLVLQTFLIQVIILGGLNWQLTRQLRLAGESASKALVAGRSPLSN